MSDAVPHNQARRNLNDLVPFILFRDLMRQQFRPRLINVRHSVIHSSENGLSGGGSAYSSKLSKFNMSGISSAFRNTSRIPMENIPTGKGQAYFSNLP